MVVPVVSAVVAGGYLAGVAAVTAGFLAWDFVFIPPYYTLSVGAGQNWVALGVYVVVMLLVAQVVASLDLARTRQLPPYVICHDRTLKTIARIAPANLQILQQIKGMGPYKVQEYGQAFLDAVRD